MILHEQKETNENYQKFHWTYRILFMNRLRSKWIVNTIDSNKIPIKKKSNVTIVVKANITNCVGWIRLAFVILDFLVPPTKWSTIVQQMKWNKQNSRLLFFSLSFVGEFESNKSNIVQLNSFQFRIEFIRLSSIKHWLQSVFNFPFTRNFVVIWTYTTSNMEKVKKIVIRTFLRLFSNDLRN